MYLNIYLRIISLILITYSISYFTCKGRNQVTTMSNYILINLMVTYLPFEVLSNLWELLRNLQVEGHD